MNLPPQITQRVREIAQKTRGVLTSKDLKLLLAPKNSRGFLLRIQDLIEAGVIRRFCQGVYVSPEFDWEVLSQTLAPDSYVSFEFVLSKNLLIGVRPDREIKAVKVGKKRVYQNEVGRIIHLGIKPELFFGFNIIQGVKVAEVEKAWLDTLYFHQRGYSFSFDIFSDVDLSKINKRKLKGFLKRYENSKFRSFAERLSL